MNHVYNVKYYSAFTLVVVLIYAFCTLARIRFTGTDSGKWAPTGQNKYHK